MSLARRLTGDGLIAELMRRPLIGPCAVAGTLTVAVFIAAYSVLCWSEDLDASPTCSGSFFRRPEDRPARGEGSGGSPLVVEFAAVAALCVLWIGVPPPLLPAWRARLALLRCLAECHGYVVGFASLGPWRRRRADESSDPEISSEASDAEVTAVSARAGAVEKRMIEKRAGGDGDELDSDVDEDDGDGEDDDEDDGDDRASSPLTFQHVLVTDALTSAGLLLWQVEYTACLFATSSWTDAHATKGWQCMGSSANATYAKPLMIALPYWLRLWQCVTQLRCRGGNRWDALNALKYVTCLAVVGTSACLRLARLDDAESADGEAPLLVLGLTGAAWRRCWIATMCVKTGCCYAWDVVMDWGLMRVNPCSGGSASGRNGDARAFATDFDADDEGDDIRRSRPLLRSKLMYGSRRFYYFAMAMNLAARISWSLAISPHWCGADRCALASGLLEMLRRAVWTLLRVENEALSIVSKGQRRRRRRRGQCNAPDRDLTETLLVHM